MIKAGDKYIVEVMIVANDVVSLGDGYSKNITVSRSFIDHLPKAVDTSHDAWNLAGTIALMPQSMRFEKFNSASYAMVIHNYSYEEAKAIVDECRQEHKRESELSKIHMAVKKAMKENNKTCKEEDLVRFINSLDDIKD